MSKYIIRLDDATPKMNKEKWQRIERILDKYGIKPLVGVIPDSKDEIFIWDEDETFWSQTIARWIGKGWTIAQHGYHHVYHNCGNGKHSEYIGLNYSQQKENIFNGYRCLINKSCKPSCFFAPGHSFDSITVDVCRDLQVFDFISDGYAFYPYVENGMLFLPNVYDTPHALFPFGVYTFIIHPSFATDSSMKKLEDFIRKHQKRFVSAEDIIKDCKKDRKRNIADKSLELIIRMIRSFRKK